MSDRLPEATTGYQDVTPRIMAFLEKGGKIEGSKSGEACTLDSAEWYIEAALNFSVASAWLECDQTSVDSLEFSMPVGSNGVLISDAFAAYNVLRDQLEAMIDESVEHLIVADVSFSEVVGSEVSARVLIQKGFDYDKAGPNTSYGPNDYIYFGFLDQPNNNCGCGPNNGGATQCADIRIQQRVRATLPRLNVNCYYSSVTTRGVKWQWGGADANYSHTDFPTGIPATPFKTYYCQNAVTCTNCLSPAQMSFYTQGMYDVMMQLKPSNRTASAVTVDDWFFAGGENAEYYHMALFTYGQLNCGTNQ